MYDIVMYRDFLDLWFICKCKLYLHNEKKYLHIALYACTYTYVCAGVGGYDGDGDITKPDNLVAFQNYVLEQTEGMGVHFVMADGVRMYRNATGTYM